MGVQYKTSVGFDTTLADLEFTDAQTAMVQAGLARLIISAVKITTGAPTATVGRFIPGAIIQNAVSGVVYRNSGSVASPVWTALPTSAVPFVTVLAGTATGGTTATRAYTITGALASDVASAVIRASTNAVSIQKATLTADTLTVLFSGDPGASTSVDYTITRAAA